MNDKDDVTRDWIALIGYRDSDENERRISALLSSEAIPFTIWRYEGHAVARPRMTVVVHPDRHEEAFAILRAAATAKEIEIFEGDEGAHVF